MSLALYRERIRLADRQMREDFVASAWEFCLGLEVGEGDIRERLHAMTDEELQVEVDAVGGAYRGMAREDREQEACA